MEEILNTAKSICEQVKEMDYNSQCAVVSIVQEVINATYQKNVYQASQE